MTDAQNAQTETEKSTGYNEDDHKAAVDAVDNANTDLTEANEAVGKAETNVASGKATVSDKTEELNTAASSAEQAQQKLEDAQKVSNDAKNANDAANTALDTARANTDTSSDAYKTAKGALDQANANLESANAAKESADKAVVDANTAVETAKNELVTKANAAADAKDALDQANKELETAKTNANTADTNKTAAQADVDAKTKAVTDANSALAEAKNALSAANTTLTNARNEKKAAQANLEAAEKAVTDAQAALDAANEKYNQGSIGYFNSKVKEGETSNAAKIIAEEQALATSSSSKYPQAALNPADPTDASSLENFKAAFEYIKRANELRASEGLDPLKVSDELFAIAQADANMENYLGTHWVDNLYVYNVGENWAGTSNEKVAFYLWYNVEKIVYDYKKDNENATDEEVLEYLKSKVDPSIFPASMYTLNDVKTLGITPILLIAIVSEQDLLSIQILVQILLHSRVMLFRSLLVSGLWQLQAERLVEQAHCMM